VDDGEVERSVSGTQGHGVTGRYGPIAARERAAQPYLRADADATAREVNVAPHGDVAGRLCDCESELIETGLDRDICIAGPGDRGPKTVRNHVCMLQLLRAYVRQRARDEPEVI
jgi:hypothetical protein